MKRDHELEYRFSVLELQDERALSEADKVFLRELDDDQAAPGDGPTEDQAAETVAAPDLQPAPVAAPIATPGLDISLAPGCYGMGASYREGSDECGTCPFASSCKPLAEQQLVMLHRVESHHDIVKKQNCLRKRKQRDEEKDAPAPAPVVKAAAPLSPSKVMLAALERVVAGRRSTDRFLEKLVNREKQKEYVRVAIIAWLKPELSAAKIAELYNAKTGKTGKDPLDKKKVENRMDVVKKLVAAGIWKPFQSGANP